MHRLITITPEDIRQAVINGAPAGDVEARLRRRLKLPGSAGAQSATAHLQRRSATLHEMVAHWMQGSSWALSKRSSRLPEFHLLPFCPRDIDARHYLLPRLKKLRPRVIGVDAGVFETAAALQYACSVLFVLGIPGRVMLSDLSGSPCAEHILQPDDLLPALALYCQRNKIALVPLGNLRRPVASEHQHVYSTILNSLYREFAAHATPGLQPAVLQELGAALMNGIFAAGAQHALERDNCITRSCALASRTYELLQAGAVDRDLFGPVVVLHHLETCLDMPALLQTFVQDPSALRELCSPPEPQPDGKLSLASPVADAPTAAPMTKTAHTALAALILERMTDTVGLAEADRLIAELACALRRHPRIERPPGVRATLAAHEIAQAFALLRGSLSRLSLAQSAAIACTHRTRMVQGPGADWPQVFKTLISNIIYGIALEADPEEQRPQKLHALTRDELNQALEGLMDAGLRQLEPGEALPLDNPDFAEEVMQHPLVQQALKNAAPGGDTGRVDELFPDMMEQMAERGLLEESGEAGMTLSAAGQDQYRSNLENAYSRNDISAEDMTDTLSQASCMPQPAAHSEPQPMSGQEQAEMLAELMDFQHQGRSETSSVEDLYVHYTINENKGIPTSKDKVDYEKLKVILHQLEDKGQLQLSSDRHLRFTLTHRALDGLLEHLVRRRESRILEQRAFKREHDTDKSEIRRYRRGDIFRDISMRHTLRRIMRKGKTIEDINYTDLRTFEKRPSNQLDIAVCVDISASMKESGKLRYAKMAIAELCKAAIDKRDRVGIVAFSNLGDVMVPLTGKITPLLEAAMKMRSGQFTNIGNGLSTARRMLLKSRQENPKYIILITDGEPNAALSDDIEGADYYNRIADFSRTTSMATKRALGAQHALREAARTSREHIKISVVYIAPDTEGINESERVAREIARLGGGRFQRVTAIERLPLEALETVA